MNEEAIEYKVKIDSFEGPISMLLNLIESKKLDINDLSLSNIADDYLNTVRSIDKFPAEQAAQFIYTASVLLLIKSKILLPLLSQTEEDHSDIELLKQKLKILKSLRLKSDETLKELRKRLYLSSPARIEREVKFSPTKDCTLKDMRILIEQVTKKMDIFEKRTDVSIKSVIKLEEMMQRIEKVLDNINDLKFFDVAEKKTKKDFAVSFLALLELIKTGVCTVRQDSKFSDISIEKTKL